VRWSARLVWATPDMNISVATESSPPGGSRGGQQGDATSLGDRVNQQVVVVDLQHASLLVIYDRGVVVDRVGSRQYESGASRVLKGIHLPREPVACAVEEADQLTRTTAAAWKCRTTEPSADRSRSPRSARSNAPLARRQRLECAVSPRPQLVSNCRTALQVRIGARRSGSGSSTTVP
jgi:hypothetical protein